MLLWSNILCINEIFYKNLSTDVVTGLRLKMFLFKRADKNTANTKYNEYMGTMKTLNRISTEKLNFSRNLYFWSYKYVWYKPRIHFNKVWCKTWSYNYNYEGTANNLLIIVYVQWFWLQESGPKPKHPTPPPSDPEITIREYFYSVPHGYALLLAY